MLADKHIIYMSPGKFFFITAMSLFDRIRIITMNLERIMVIDVLSTKYKSIGILSCTAHRTDSNMNHIVHIIGNAIGVKNDM